MLTNLSKNEAKKNFFFEKKNSKWPTQKNWVFQPPPKAEQLSPKFHRLVLGLVELIDAKGINVTQSMWPWGWLTKGQKQPKNTKYAFLGCFCPYVRQPHNHIGWATSMPFASINPTNPRTNPWNFHKKILRIGHFEKWPFWTIGHFEFYFSKKKKIFCLISIQNNHKYIG